MADYRLVLDDSDAGRRFAALLRPNGPRTPAYEAASREAKALIAEAARTCYWAELPEKLIELRDTMSRTWNKPEVPANG